MSLKGKVALVMGGSRGIGAATSEILAARGAYVVMSYLQNIEAAKQVVSKIKENGGTIRAVQADVREREQVRQLVQTAQETYGHVDILVYSIPPLGAFKPFVTMSWEDSILGVTSHLKGIFETTQAVLPIMQKQQAGRIVLVSSGWARTPALDGLSSLAPAFAAQANLLKVLAKEYGPEGITINAVAPAMVETELNAAIPPARKQQIAAMTPLRRIAQPEDIARVIAFLASEDSRYVTGVSIPVNGGLSME